MSNKLSIEEGIKIQTEQLERWGLVLHEQVHKDLVQWATSRNNDVTDGFGICRGDDLTIFIKNYKPKVKTNTKKIVTIEVTRYYSKTNTVEIEVDNDLVFDDLVNYLSADEELDNRFEIALAEAQLVGEDTTYEWQDPTNQTGGTL